MQLTNEERAMLAGAAGPARQWAIDHQMRVGRYLGAADFVPVSQAHIMADTESLGVAGVEWLERLAAMPEDQRRVRITWLDEQEHIQALFCPGWRIRPRIDGVSIIRVLAYP